jgi:aminopeptidase-like protein
MIMNEFNLLKFCQDLYTIPRSLTGSGVRETLRYIKKIIPIDIKKVKSGTKVFDWVVPEEWNIKSAYIIEKETGKKIIDFNNHRLHIMGYSKAINCEMTYEDLVPKLYFLKDQPDAIPYVTSYYKKDWGFCLSYNEFKKLKKLSNYIVHIDSSFNPDGFLNYGELLIPGEKKEEILFSSYICHPQMVNNELSGPSVLTGIANYLLNRNNYYSYRFVLIPETIGSITYISKNLKRLKELVKGGYNITCVGDERDWGLVPSRYGNNISDEIAEHILKHNVTKYTKYSWLDRGSDERQYCAPGVDLPISSITRTKYGMYPEYHTSLDDFNVVTAKGLAQSLEVYIKCVKVFELNKNIKPKIKVYGEPQLGKRGLYPNISTKTSANQVKNMMNFISYCDGNNTILEISNLCNISFFDSIDIYDKLKANQLIF